MIAIIVWIVLCVAVAAAERKMNYQAMYAGSDVEPKPVVAHNAHMAQLKAEWTDAAGVKHTVTTTQLDGEAVDAFVQRHKTIVDAYKAAFPPS